MTEEMVLDAASELLRTLVRIDSVNPSLGGPGDGEGAVAEVLRARLQDAGLETRILTSPQGRPSLVARVPGPTDVPPLVLLSHLDVVPAPATGWRHDPFGGEVVDGELWGRGTLDMKGIAVMHAEAAAALAGSSRTPSREVVVVAVADEEAGGAQGAGWLVDEHADLVGLRADGPAPEVLGEGAFGMSGILARPLLPIMLGEKSPLLVRATANAPPGHAAMPPPEQAIRRLARFVEDVSGPSGTRLHPIVRDMFATLGEDDAGRLAPVFRTLGGHGGQLAVRALAPVLRSRAPTLGHLVSDTVTPTRIEAGVAHNVLPGSAELLLDVRVLPDQAPDELLARLRRAARRHGVTLSVEHWDAHASSPRTGLFDLLADASRALPGSPLPVPSITPGTTDLRFFRARGATAYAWVPLVLSPELLATFHGDDERIPLDGFDGAGTAMREVVQRAAS